MSYVQTEAVLPASDTPEPLLSDYLVEAFAHPTTLVVPVASYSRTMHRPIAEPYGLDQATGPAYREDPPSTISYGGPAPPLESRKVRPITDTSPQIQDPINHVIKTPWEDVLADKRTVAAPCKRTTVLQKDFVPSDVDLGLDDVETINPATVALPTGAEAIADVTGEAASKADDDGAGKFDVDNEKQMKNSVDVPEIEAEPINQDAIDKVDEPPKGLVQELTAAIVTQLKAEGILAGGGGGGGAAQVASNPGAAAFSQQMMEMLMAQQQQMMMANAADGGGGLAAPMTMMAPMQPGGDGADNRINLGERGKPTPITSLGSALLTARVAGMSYDNQAPLRGIKTATMNPYRPVVAEPAKANVWQARQRPTIGAVKGLMDRQQGGDPTSLAGSGDATVIGAEGKTRPAHGGGSADDRSHIVGAAQSMGNSAAGAAPAAPASGAGDGDFDLGKDDEGAAAKAHISDEEPALTAEQQKDLFTKCLNNRAQAVEELFSMGVPVDTADDYGNTCLHVACQGGSKRMVKACLRWGADINQQNKQGQTPLHYCLAYKYDDLASYLISKGADDTVVNNFGLTCYEGLKPEDTQDEK
ncbi:Ankyrin repeat domain-containing protein [Plasmodiophora brassicae]